MRRRSPMLTDPMSCDWNSSPKATSLVMMVMLDGLKIEASAGEVFRQYGDETACGMTDTPLIWRYVGYPWFTSRLSTTVGLALSDWSPARSVVTLKGIPVMGMSPAFVPAVTVEGRRQSDCIARFQDEDSPFAVPCSSNTTSAVLVMALKKKANAWLLRDCRMALDLKSITRRAYGRVESVYILEERNGWKDAQAVQSTSLLEPHRREGDRGQRYQLRQRDCRWYTTSASYPRAYLAEGELT
jgi:hypothetical protein